MVTEGQILAALGLFLVFAGIILLKRRYEREKAIEEQALWELKEASITPDKPKDISPPVHIIVERVKEGTISVQRGVVNNPHHSRYVYYRAITLEDKAVKEFYKITETKHHVRRGKSMGKYSSESHSFLTGDECEALWEVSIGIIEERESIERERREEEEHARKEAERNTLISKYGELSVTESAKGTLGDK